MQFNFKAAWAQLPAKQRRIVAVVGAVCVVLGAIALIQGEDKTPRYNKKSEQVTNVFTDSSNKNASIDSISGQLRQLQRRMNDMTDEMKAVRQLAPEQRMIQLEERLKKSDERLAARIDGIAANLDRVMKQSPQVIMQPVEEEPKDAKDRTRTARTTTGRRPDAKATEHRQLSPSSDINVETPGAQAAQTAAKAIDPNNPFEATPIPDAKKREEQAKSKRGVSFTVITEPEPVKVDNKRDSVQTSEAYIPAGSILTGTIITGGDFPTNKGSFEQPTPLMIRLSKEAILPNRYTSDVRECFLLAGGAGDLASERAKLRGETLSCIRKDGSVLETQLNSYVAGEDGKEGVKGRLVSKQGQLIARTLLAGFAGGMANAFDVNPVPVLATTATGETQYQDAFSNQAVRGAAVKGMSQALDRVAQFYLSMAEDIFPVIEINAGRQVDVVVITGTRLKITAPGAVKTSKKD